MFNTLNASFLASSTCHPGRTNLAAKGATYLWHELGVSDGTHRTLCFRQRSQAKALPTLPSLASMAKWELPCGSETTVGLSAAAASARMWGNPSIAPSPGGVKVERRLVK